MKNLLILFTFTLLFSACKQKTTTTQSALGAITNACVIGKWSDSRLPLTVKMSADFNGDLVGGVNPLENMARLWNNAVAPRVLINTPFPEAATRGYSNTSSFKDGEIGIYKSINWFSNVQNDAIAITQYYGVMTTSPGLGQYVDITHSDIIVNYKDFGGDLTMNINTNFEYDLPTVILHEMGHLLGLCHEKKKPSIMAPYYVTTQHALQNYDKDLIKDLYVDGAISALSAKNNNANALSVPSGTEVRGIIELRADGKCVHYLNGEKTLEHDVDINLFKKKKK